ncbi:uncharacterized protein BDR25DRAFT_275323 [Lindgomyces ingoldianus]|uniref:Uncharacterized protein n=1 Tax=Lindgomyces ingoldianus TaxID=673940 RepID=A0ACB6REZ7_9PLEO|nr:uncharacterized protein BDR25DRAFT_275323 [Lindgomyces ingoldianus]KAF2477849.1 hypothetical protein BDR25DRAFT_275323 [Lindgomyces ingoldianus]
MSSFIAIPKRKKKQGESSAATPSPSSSSSFAYGSFASSAGSPNASSVAPSPLSRPAYDRRPSLMSPAFTKAEHTVINVGNSECPRLITCVKASQGFDWNQEIFLPSYADYHFDDLERKQDPVQDIHVSDEEIANMFPS